MNVSRTENKRKTPEMGGIAFTPCPLKLQKTGPADDPEAFLHTFEKVAEAAKWSREQWTLILMPCLTGLVQEIVDTMVPEDVKECDKVKATILGTLNLSEEAYQRRFRDLRFKLVSPSRTLMQRMKASAVQWLKPAIRASDQVVELVVADNMTLPSQHEELGNTQPTYDAGRGSDADGGICPSGRRWETTSMVSGQRKREREGTGDDPATVWAERTASPTPQTAEDAPSNPMGNRDTTRRGGIRFHLDPDE